MSLLTAGQCPGFAGWGRGGDGWGGLPPPALPSDCPQVQCVHPYVAQQPDELTLELADILNILDKTEDGKAGAGRVAHSCTRDSAPTGTSLRMRLSPRWGSWRMGRQAQDLARLCSPRPLRPSWLPQLLLSPEKVLLPGSLFSSPQPARSASPPHQAQPEHPFCAFPRWPWAWPPPSPYL